MRLRHLEVLQAVLQGGTLTAAAGLLQVSQPAATRLLQNAEAELGFPLFERQSGGLRLTAQARALRAHLGRITDGTSEVERLVRRFAAGLPAPMRLACTPALARAVLPRALMSLRQVQRELAVDLTVVGERQLPQALLLGEAELAFSLQPVDHPGVRGELLWQGGLMVIAPLGWWPAKEHGAALEVTELAGAPLVDGADGAGCAQAWAHLAGLATPPRVSLRARGADAVRSLVRAGHGLALLDPFTAFGDGDAAVLSRPLAPAIPLALHALSPAADCGGDAAARACIDAVRAAAAAVAAMLPAVRRTAPPADA